MKQGKVRIVADESGNVVRMTNNPEYGYIMLAQKGTYIHDRWLKSENRTTLITGKLSDLIQADFQADQELPGKIVIKETLQPVDPNNEERNQKIAGNTGIPCTIDGQRIYRTSFYTTDETEQDEYIQHDNTDVIREKSRELREAAQQNPVSL